MDCTHGEVDHRRIKNVPFFFLASYTSSIMQALCIHKGIIKYRNAAYLLARKDAWNMRISLDICLMLIGILVFS